MRWAAGAGDFSSAVLFPSPGLHSREYERNRPLRAPDALAGRGSWLLGHCIFASAQAILWTKQLYHRPPLYWDQRAHWTALALTTPPANGTLTTALLQCQLRPANTLPLLLRTPNLRRDASEAIRCTISLRLDIITCHCHFALARGIPRVTSWHLRPPRKISSGSAWPLAPRVGPTANHVAPRFASILTGASASIVDTLEDQTARIRIGALLSSHHKVV